MSASADRNLLFGILALQMDFITRDALVAAMHAWVLAKSTPLGLILVERGDLAPAHRALLDPLVDAHIARHGGDAHQSLAALSSVTPVKAALASIAEPEVLASVAVLGAAHGPVVPPSGEHWVTVAPAAVEGTAPGMRFRILRPHARGGLGEVFVARDEELGRTVALKEIQYRHLDRPDLRARFVVEAEINGNLEHPGIVPVYGLGTYPDGRPFYAMRFIQGDSLKDAIEGYHRDAPRLSPTERMMRLRQLLGRFIDVCDAIAYAHSRGVLHRDLKPANVMLGKYGETLVVDWGLAKPLGRTDAASAADSGPTDGPLVPRSGDSSEPTLAGHALGTPGFMSPEQAEGRLDQLGPATDVYSLGATLYCLLTGKPPLTGEDILARIIRGDIPPPRSVSKDVPRALEAVCLKAMALTPADRYPSARALAEDVEHWLADEPVSAWPEPILMSAARWARRHRSWVTAGIVALAVVALVASVATGVIGQALARERAALVAETRARAQAKDRLAQARESIDTLLTAVAEGLAAVPGAQKVRRQLLEKAAGQYQHLADERGGDLDLRFESGSASMRLGEIRSQLGDFAAAQENLEAGEAVLSEVLVLRDTLDARLNLAQTRIRLADVLSSRGRGAQAEAAYRRSIEGILPFSRAHPEHRLARSLLGIARTHLAVDLAESSRDLETESLFRDAIADLEAATPPPRPETRKTLASAHSGFARFLARRGHTSDAEHEYRAAISRGEDLLRDFPDRPDSWSVLTAAQRNLAKFLLALERGDEAEKLLIVSLAKREAGVRDNPDIPHFIFFLASSREAIGDFYRARGRFREAEDMCRRSIDELDKLARAQPDVPEYRYRRALGRGSLAYLLMDLGRYFEAEGQAASSVGELRFLREAHPNVLQFSDSLGNNLNNLGRIQKRMGKLDAAAASFQAGIAVYEQLAGGTSASPGNRDMLGLMSNNLATVYINRQEFERAIPLGRRAVAVYESLVKDHPEISYHGESLVMSRTSLATALLAAGSVAEARVEVAAAVAFARDLVASHPAVPLYQVRLIQATLTLGNVEAGLGRPEAALTALDESSRLNDELIKAYPDSAEHSDRRWEVELSRAEILLDLDRPADAAAAVDAVASQPSRQPAIYFTAARLLYRVVAKTESSADAAKIAGRAIGLLREAYELGNRDPAQYTGEADLAPLRDRPDFQKLVLDLMDRAMPADPFQR